ncbi:hypothetical protein ACOSQ3_006613 [Xanthoceras sorbifolium]
MPEKELMATIPADSKSRSEDRMAVKRRDSWDSAGNHKKGKEQDAVNQIQLDFVSSEGGKKVRDFDKGVLSWTGPHDSGGMVAFPDLGHIEESPKSSIGLLLSNEMTQIESKVVMIISPFFISPANKKLREKVGSASLEWSKTRTRQVKIWLSRQKRRELLDIYIVAMRFQDDHFTYLDFDPKQAYTENGRSDHLMQCKGSNSIFPNTSVKMDVICKRIIWSS